MPLSSKAIGTWTTDDSSVGRSVGRGRQRAGRQAGRARGTQITRSFSFSVGSGGRTPASLTAAGTLSSMLSSQRVMVLLSPLGQAALRVMCFLSFGLLPSARGRPDESSCMHACWRARRAPLSCQRAACFQPWLQQYVQLFLHFLAAFELEHEPFLRCFLQCFFFSVSEQLQCSSMLAISAVRAAFSASSLSPS